MKHLLSLSVFLLTAFAAFGQVPDSTKTKADSVATPAAAPAAAAQTEPQENKRSFREKIAFGFGTGFWITPSTTYVEVAPSIAYLWPRALTTGVGFRYIYRHDRYINNDLHSYGPNVFARLDLLKRIYFWTEYEYLYNQYFNYAAGNKNDYTRETDNIDSWFMGLGYSRSVGRRGRGGISVQVLYNFLYDNTDRNPYYSAWCYRVGYFF